jgi:predicted secreted protein
MFNDARSKSVVFVAHCILNQNAISDGTASFPGFVPDIIDILRASDVGIIQMPCPELHCLGLDRGNVYGGSFPVVEENTRIRKVLSQHSSTLKIKQLAQHIVFQMLEYRKHGFDIQGIIGINRSPSCGVDTTSKDNQEVHGEGIFIEALRREFHEHAIHVELVGIKAFETEKAVITVKKLLGIK